MRILILCDRYPYPLENGQNLRIYNYVKLLGETFSFDLLCYADSPVPEPVSRLFRQVVTCKSPSAQPKQGLARLSSAFSVRDMIPSSTEFSAELMRLLEQENYDLIWVSGWDTVVNLPKSMGVPVLADMVDDGVLEYWRELKKSRSPIHFLRMLKWLWMIYRFERRYFSGAERCLFVSEVDARFFQRICPGTPVSVIHNGVDECVFKPLGTEKKPFNLVFEGNISFRPNTDGILYFCKEVLPIIHSVLPEVTLSIVGKKPPEEVKALASDKIEVTGFVEDVRPYLDRAALFVCPLRKGAGIKNKVLQAWAMGLPVVASTASTGGLAVDEGVNVLVRDDPEEFASAVIKLLEEPALARTIGMAARKTIIQNYTWAKKSGDLAKLMTDMVRGPGNA